MFLCYYIFRIFIKQRHLNLARMISPPTKLHCREIVKADLPAVATLLHRGFPRHSRQFWLRALELLTKRKPPPDLPKYGYLMENEEVPVGVLLQIYSTIREHGRDVTRCNLSSWYVEPKFRTYATLLHFQACRREDIIYLNVSPSKHTLPIIEAEGFARYCDGVFITTPMLGGEKVRVFGAHRQPKVAFDVFERDLLLEHATYGCISLWCATSDRAYPFVFRPRRLKAVVPAAQLIYCRHVADFVRFAGPIGRFLTLRGRPFIMVDANESMRGLVGMFFRGWTPPRCFKGPQRPRLGDLAYTEFALWGV